MRESAIFYPPPTEGGPPAFLQIEGGLICGGKPAVVLPFDPANPDAPIPASSPVTQGVCLSSKYNPGYLKSVSTLGDFRLVSLRKVR